MKSGTGSGRGRHRNAGSPETRKWLEVAPTVDGWKQKPKRKPKRAKNAPSPARPPWLHNEAYRLLVEMRAKL